MDSFYVMGVAAKTTNENLQAVQDMKALWGRFFSENLMEKIPNKVSNEIYNVYTDYEGDHTDPYTVIVGCKVSSIDEVPEGLVTKEIPAGTYKEYLVTGDLMGGAVGQKWQEIWKTDLDRTYGADFDVYGDKPDEMKIYVGVK